MHAVCSDLEGVWVPEVWINVSLKTGIDDLKYTTRDIKDYDELMQHGLKLKDIQDVIATIKPLDGAPEMVSWLKKVTRFIVVSDTFVEFASPLIRQIDWPTLFCHSLVVDGEGNITGYTLRQKDSKKKVILNYQVIAFGDSYNDISMLQEADSAILFDPPQNVADDYPQFTVIHNYKELKEYLLSHFEIGQE